MRALIINRILEDHTPSVPFPAPDHAEHALPPPMTSGSLPVLHVPHLSKPLYKTLGACLTGGGLSPPAAAGARDKRLELVASLASLFGNSVDKPSPGLCFRFAQAPGIPGARAAGGAAAPGLARGLEAGIDG